MGVLWFGLLGDSCLGLAGVLRLDLLDGCYLLAVPAERFLTGVSRGASELVFWRAFCWARQRAFDLAYYLACCCVALRWLLVGVA